MSMMNRKEYEQFCKDAENMHVYDGRGTYDLYECQKSTCDSKGILTIEKGCDNLMITTYRDKGVTPFSIRCPECGEELHHTKTLSEAQMTDAMRLFVEQWVRPSYEHYKHLPKVTREYVERGGLVLKKDLIGLIPH